jgi:hypothetical protein
MPKSDVKNSLMQSCLQTGAPYFTVPMWMDLIDTEANLYSDNPADTATSL